MTISRTVQGLSILLVCVGTCGCATTGETDSMPANDNMDAVVWLQASPEYAAVTTGIYATATARIREIANREGSRIRSLVIVMDVDETVLDNSRYQGQLVSDKVAYDSESWDAWVALRAADAVPGVVDFVRTSQSLGFHVAFVTNRTCRSRPKSGGSCPQAADTLANLKDIGVDTSSITLFLRGDRPSDRCRAFLSESERVDGTWSSDKTSRRDCVGLDHDIIMLFGDQLGDFREAVVDASGRSGRDVAAEYLEYWGKTWFMLPNPTYGAWKPRDPAGKRSLIRGID